MKKRLIKNKNGFSLVELIVTIAILAVMTAALTPALLNYVEKSRAEKDRFAMDEIVNAVRVSAANEDVYNELLRFSTPMNVSCYIDTQDENTVSDYKKVVRLAKQETEEDQYVYTDIARSKDETFYNAVGNMRGLTITFRPNNKTYVVEDAVINQFVGNTADPNTPAVASVTDGSTRQQTNGTFTLKNMNRDEPSYLCGLIQKTVGRKIPISSHTYKNSEFTVFIRINEGLDVYGEFDGTNLPGRIYNDIVNPLPDIPVKPETEKPQTPSGGGGSTPVTPTPNVPQSGGNTPALPNVPDEVPEETEPEEGKEKVVPLGGIYYVKVSSEKLNPDGYIKGKTCEDILYPGDPFPEIVQSGDAYVINGYECRNNQEYDAEDNEWETEEDNPNVWNVTVINRKKAHYGDLDFKIKEEGLTHLKGTFEDCDKLIKSPEIPDTIVSMEETFEDCTSLVKTPKLPDGLISMEETFEGCTNLKEITNIPDSVLSMEETFEDTGITECPKLPPMLTNAEGLFSGSMIKHAPEIPFTVKIMDEMFEDCIMLEEAPDLPPNLISMEEAFEGCVKLKNAPHIPSGVKNMEEAFKDCKALKSAPVIPESVVNLEKTFANCTNLSGSVVVNAKSLNEYKQCFGGTSGTISIIGSAPDNVKQKLNKTISTHKVN